LLIHPSSSLDPIAVAQVIPLIQSIVPYTTTHTYRFVIDIGPGLKFLTLGDSDGGVFDNSGEFSVQLFAVSATVPFTSFASRLNAQMIAGASNDVLQLSGTLALGPGSNGINPLTEDVTVTFGNVSKLIPAGSFTKNRQGAFRV
jgi:hypothetical protein